MSHDPLLTPAAAHWKRIGIKPHHGIDLPLSALHSSKSSGIGEFFDLLPLIDWCASVGFDTIQLLPLDDTLEDNSPYNAVSAHALSPLYLSLHALPFLDEFKDLKESLKPMQLLTHAHRVSFFVVTKMRTSWLNEYLTRALPRLLHEVEDFCKLFPWVVPYALFKRFKRKLENKAWWHWPEEIRNLNDNKRKELLSSFHEELLPDIALQWLSYAQMEAVKSYAEGRGILLKGDLPLLLNRDSVDVWWEPHLFDMSIAAGSPPDAYSKEGQYWGFPIFRWKEGHDNVVKWWEERMQIASHFYHLYRLDHAVGFFRIWGIPLNRPAKEGKFYPENSQEWIPQGRRTLEELLHSCSLLPIAEDLGTVPHEVRVALEELGIPGTKVMRWERDWNGDGHYLPYASYPPISLTTVSTHDSETLALWWRDLPEEAKPFCAFKGWQYTPELSTEQRREILRDSHQTPSLFHINLLQEYLALFPQLVWEDIRDERINVPGKLLPTNWSYRFRCSVEMLLAHEGLKSEIANILAPSPIIQK